MLVRIANREDSDQMASLEADQTTSLEAVWSGSALFAFPAGI